MFRDQGRFERANKLSFIDSVDSLDQLDAVGLQQVKSLNAKKIEGDLARYLEGIYLKLSSKNEIIFDDEKKPKFYIANDEIAYHFSLPNRVFVFSSTLFKKFISNEEILVSIICYESIRSLKSVYKKNEIIPNKEMKNDVFFKLFKIESEEKIKVDQWVYVVLKRGGFDPGAYLKYLQMRNKINEDRSPVPLSRFDLAKEELMYKSFMVKQKIKGRGVNVNKENSSRDFYALLKFVERI